MTDREGTSAEHISAQQFHEAPGTAGWHVLYGGAQAIFPTDSLQTGAEFALRVADAAAELDREPDIDLRPHAVAVCTARNRRGRLDRIDAEVARRVSDVASGMGLAPDASRLQTAQIGIAQAEGVDTSEFWLAALGYERVDDVLADPLRRGPRLWFYELDRPGRGRTHIDVAVPNDQGAPRAAAAIAAGGRLAIGDDIPAWWGLASPDNHSVDIAAWGDVSEQVM
ncbi:VOC family protein [Microbacterium sp. ASV49]|uniref:VOC family protein n=1 Tax=Microbacterium candidum TaxID=3041922 RepID=A0ABT7MWS8_9MICO|nr:VOC family protein [Microbacterium sp. ASV49]MDL9978906.1 VOC family protein [Microbacterium sp. ASV49]